ncbi:MAG: ribonuclease Z [Flavobacteriales bacterium]|nr:ribonuclease Z [Flavobacteriales bacterium]
MTFEVTILGCGAALPTLQQHPSAQVVNVHDKLFLVDCGEGTQVRLRESGIRFQKINHLFISHMHGDHYHGLFGYLSTMRLLGRKTPVHVYGPPDLERIARLNLEVSETYLDYELHFHHTPESGKHLLFEDQSLEVWSFPLRHRIRCNGFHFCEKPRQLNVKKGMVKKYKLQPSQIIQLKKGGSIQLGTGDILTPAAACELPKPVRTYAYCSDTSPYEELAKWIGGVNLMYHESTFLESERKRAKDTYHSTAQQAAEMAVRCGAGQLLLGHFSSRYSDKAEFLTEASAVFPQVLVSEEGETYKVV